MGKLFKWLFVGFAALTILGMVIEGMKTPEQKAVEQAQRAEKQRITLINQRIAAEQEMKNLPSYTAGQLARAYEENTVAADGYFKGKKFKVSGTVASINTDLFGNPYLTLRGGVNQFMEPQFSFDDSSSSALATLKKGQKVQLVCVGKGDVAKTPMSDDCILM